MLVDTHGIRWIGRGQTMRDWLLRCGGGRKMETGQITEASACRNLLYALYPGFAQAILLRTSGSESFLWRA